MATQTKALLLVAGVSLAVASFIFRAQFHGEDEVGVYITATWLADAVSSGDLPAFLQILIGSYHPPGRFLLATASFLLFSPSPFALRLPAVVVWAATCVLAALITRRLTGAKVVWPGLLSGLLLGGSGLFSLEALGFGHGVLTFWVMAFMWLKIKHPLWHLDSVAARRHYVLGGLILAMGFLWFTSLLPIAGLYHLYFLYGVMRQSNIEKLRQYALLTLPFCFFYAAYYLIFLGLPWYAVEQGLRERAVGQLHQNIARSVSAGLNIVSAIENVRGLNWYHVPFVSWFLLAVGVAGQWRWARPLTFILTPYALLFSFYIVDNTLQHFLSYYIWLVPFALAALWQWGARRGQDWQGVVVCFLVATCIATFSFGYVANMRQYTEATYPYDLAPRVWGSGKWRSNLVRPLPKIADDLAKIVGPSDRWTVTIDGALPLYYFADSRYVSPESVTCGELRAQVRAVGQALLCDVAPERLLHYSESLLELVVLQPID